MKGTRQVKVTQTCRLPIKFSSITSHSKAFKTEAWEAVISERQKADKQRYSSLVIFQWNSQSEVSQVGNLTWCFIRRLLHSVIRIFSKEQNFCLFAWSAFALSKRLFSPVIRTLTIQYKVGVWSDTKFWSVKKCNLISKWKARDHIHKRNY